MTIAKSLHIRLFLEGVEVPVVSASVQCNPNSPAVASIQVVPLDEATKLRPRTMVHLFFYQPKEWESAMAEESEAVLRDRYKLLFCGEVVGFSFVRTPMSRAVILQCVDFSSYWDACHSTAVEWGPSGNAFHDDAFLNAGGNHFFDNIVNQQPNVILGWLGQQPQTPGLQSVSGLAGGIIRMLEAIGGVTGRAKGVNDFFTVAELRARILSQIGAEENDSTARRLMDAQVFQQWLSNGLENAGLQSTFRDLLKLLFQYIFYDVVPNPAAHYVPAKGGKTEKVAGATLGKSKVGSSAKTIIEASKKEILSRKGKDGRLTGDDTLKSAQLLLVELMAVLKRLEPLPAKVTGPTIQKIKAARRTLGLFLDAPSMEPKDRDEKIDSIVKNLDAAKAEIDKSKTPLSYTSTTDASTARLLTQIIRPDCFFAAPPRCNVLFPEHYTQLAYDRSYLMEPTRLHLMVYNQLIGFDRLFADSIVVPSLNKDFIAKIGGPAGYRSLMPHELHVGITPRSERLPDTTAGAGATKADSQDLASSRVGWAKKAALFTFFKYRLADRVINMSGRFNPNVVCGFPGLVITAPTVVKEVLASQTADPEKKAGLGTDEFSELLSSYSPMQLVGMVGAVSHNIDQNGGTTTVMLHHVRQHDGKDDEYLNARATEEKEQTRLISYVLSASSRGKDNKLLSELTPSDVTATATRMVGFSGEDIVFDRSKRTTTSLDVKAANGTSSRQEVSSESQSSETSSKEDTRPPPGTAFASIEGVAYQKKVLVPSGQVKRSAGSTGKYGNPIHAVQVLDPLVSVSADNYKVFEKVRVFEKIKVKVKTAMPVEKLLRPSWISPSYENKNIGKKIYQPFFGCDSVVDELDYYWPEENLEVISDGSGSVLDMDALKSGSGATDERIKKALKSYVEIDAEGTMTSSIERATNYLSYVYGLVRERGGDVNRFVETYTDRPIATMANVLGSHDLEFSVNSSGKVEAGSVKGTFGFHTLSVDEKVVGEDKPLWGLLDDPDLKISRLGGAGKEATVPKGYDVRWEKRNAVLAYVSALNKRKAFLG